MIVDEQNKLRCITGGDTNKFYDLSYKDASRYICVSPDDHGDILDFIHALVEATETNRSKLMTEIK